MHRVSPNKARVYSVHANPDHSTDTDNLWSGSLDVTFDLGVNDWDDFDDGNLVDASEVCYESQICNLMTDHDQPTNSGLLDSFYSLIFYFYVFCMLNAKTSLMFFVVVFVLASASQCPAQTFEVLPQR